MTQVQAQDPNELTEEALQGKAQTYMHAQENEHFLFLVLGINANRSSVMTKRQIKGIALLMLALTY